MNLSSPSNHQFSEIASTLLISLYLRAMESQCPDALLINEHAVALMQKLEVDFSRLEQAQVGDEVRVDNGQVEWYDLDLPEVIELRRNLIVGEEGCNHWR